MQQGGAHGGRRFKASGADIRSKAAAIGTNAKNGTDLIPQDQAASISQTPPHRRKPRESPFGPKSAFRLENARRPRAHLEHGAFGSSQNLN